MFECQLVLRCPNIFQVGAFEKSKKSKGGVPPLPGIFELYLLHMLRYIILDVGLRFCNESCYISVADLRLGVGAVQTPPPLEKKILFRGLLCQVSNPLSVKS